MRQTDASEEQHLGDEPQYQHVGSEFFLIDSRVWLGGVAALIGLSLISMTVYPESVFLGSVLLFSLGALPALGVLCWFLARDSLFDPVELLAFSAVVGPGLAAVLTALAYRFFGAPPTMTWLVLAAAGATSALVFGIRNPERRWRVGKRDTELIAVLICAYGIVHASILAMNPGAIVSYHGLFHTAVANAALQNPHVPEMPVMAGFPFNSNWLWHLYLGVASRVSGVGFLHLSHVGNGIALGALFFAVRHAWRNFGGGRSVSILACACALAVVFTGWARGPAWIGEIIISGGSAVGEGGLDVLAGIVRGAGDAFGASNAELDPRATMLFWKFLNVNAFPYGAALAAVVLVAGMDLLCVPTESRKPLDCHEDTLVPVLLGLSVGALFAMHATAFLFVGLACTPASAILLALRLKRGESAVIKQATVALVIGTVTTLATYVVMKPSLDAFGGAKVSLGVPIPGFVATIVLCGGFVLLLAVWGLREAVRRRDGATFLIGTATCLLVLSPLVIRLQDYNGYKSLLLSGLFGGILVASVADRIARSRRWGSAFPMIVAVIALGACTAQVVHTYHSHQLVTESLRFDHMKPVPRDAPLEKAYSFIARTAPRDAVLIELLPSQDFIIGSVVTGLPQYLAEAPIYEMGYHTVVRRRLDTLEKLYGEPEQDTELSLVPGRVHYMLIRQPETYDRAARACLESNVIPMMVFSEDGVAVLRLQSP